jgi:DNA repair ATPase RecN
MGTDISLQDLLDRKNQILDSILSGIREWDGTIEAGIDLIESNQDKLDSIKEINRQLYSIEENLVEMDNYNEKLNLIVKELGQLTTSMKMARKSVIQEMKVIERKNDVLDNYVPKKSKSIFIDKDV